MIGEKVIWVSGLLMGDTLKILSELITAFLACLDIFRFGKSSFRVYDVFDRTEK